ncbi:alpha/beta fold hydrolase [Aquabacterium sp.]|uniref:alpha/beta fold hydrolase n=1 Tax=Aquabacterium sp. TaxID=1872578 RepID=UPI002C8996E9|nr:alpha/beta fold hydrolase [Aquabacterium sp.]HSW03883.1 alpha/beta fold hydrolase [Aquabacterium sp.]
MIFMKLVEEAGPGKARPIGTGPADTIDAVSAAVPTAAFALAAAGPATLYPDTPPFRTHRLPVGDGHVLHVQEHGCAEGLPALLLHGGPGSGCSPLLRRFFDPKRYRLICMDQRGAGLSRPRGDITHNTTAHLLADLRALRAHLGLARWLVVGGSWGATLALAHAADQPQAVAALLLRASFLARADDLHWFFRGVAVEQPQAWQHFADHAPAERRDDLLPWLAEVFAQHDPARCRAIASAWSQWEQALASGAAAQASAPQADDPALGAPVNPALDALIDRYRVQSHYLLHRCWLDSPTLLDRCAASPTVPTLLLHGREDRICRPAGALALHRQLPHSALQWLDGVGHDPTHPAMVDAMVRALQCYAAQGDFGSPA